METVSNKGKQFKVIHGTRNTNIQFLCNSGLTSYTLFHVARYTGLGERQRIFANDASCDWGNFLSGFHGGHSGVCFHEGWITDPYTDYHGNDWVVSSDSYGTYHSNGISRNDNGGGSSSLPSLGINRWVWGEYSDFMVADVLVFNTKLSSSQISTIENYLLEIYGLRTPAPTASPTTRSPCPPDGYIYNENFSKCYKSYSQSLSWNDAQAICTTQNGGQLVTIQSQAENDFVTGLDGIRERWIGLNDIDQEGRWKWIRNLANGSLYAIDAVYSNWNWGEPVFNFYFFNNSNFMITTIITIRIVFMGRVKKIVERSTILESGMTLLVTVAYLLHANSN